MANLLLSKFLLFSFTEVTQADIIKEIKLNQQIKRQ